MKSVQILGFFWPVFSCIRTEYEDLLCQSANSVRIQETTEQKKLPIWTIFKQCFCIIIFSFACQYSLQCYWYCYNQKQSSDAVLQKLCFYTNSKNSQENIRKEIPAQMFPCEFWEIFHKIFLKEPLGRLLNYKHSFWLLSDHDLSPFRKPCHTYFLAEYFFGLICRLGTRVNSIFQVLNQNPASKNTL